MHEETLAKVQAAWDSWEGKAALPQEIAGFGLSLLAQENDDKYDLFAYENPHLHRSATAYYHEETHEYKLRVRIGLAEFCEIEYFAKELAAFGQLLATALPAFLAELAVFDPASLSSLFLAKGILAWEVGQELPETLEGYSLFVRPAQPVKINNGSYIIIDYVDFASESDVMIYYNVFRNEFFGEARVRGIPEVTYDFDAASLEELAERLKKYLVPHLRETREHAASLV